MGYELRVDVTEPLAADDLTSHRRKMAKATLARFPEAAALSPPELEAAVDRLMSESNPETATPAAPGMVRLPDLNVRSLLSIFHEMTPTVDELPGVADGGAFPAGWIERRKRHVDEKCRQENKKMGDDFGVFLAKIRVDLITVGYVEFQEEYLESRADLAGQVQEQDGALVVHRDWSVPSDEED